MAIRIVTHSGPFHADDVMACAILKTVYGRDAEIVRTRDPDILEEAIEDPATVVVDVGADYDPNHDLYDHHQKGGAGTRWDGEVGDGETPYASAGLVWCHYGDAAVERLVEHAALEPIHDQVSMVADIVDRTLIEPIDCLDTGYVEPNMGATISGMISRMNPQWFDENADFDTTFEEAVEEAASILKRFVRSAAGSVLAEQEVRDAPLLEDDQVMVLDRFCPWSGQRFLYEEEAYADLKYVIYKNDQGTWMVQQVPVEHGSFEGRKPLPERLAGLRGEELQKEGDIPDAVFVHPGGFIGGCKSREGALKLARLALEE